MQIGLYLANLTWPGGPSRLAEILCDVARRAEAAGISSLWMMDHFFQVPVVGPYEDPMLEAYTTLGFLAAATQRVRLGTLVSGVTYRDPALLLKTVQTLDRLSGGRAWFGVGAAWFEREHAALGIPFPPAAERLARLEETLRMARQVPHPPILIGGDGEKKTLSLVARYAQACNFYFILGETTLRRKLEVLRAHCARHGTSYDAIRKTLVGNVLLRPQPGQDRHALVLTPRQVVEIARGGEALGFEELILSIPDVASPGVIETLAEILSQLQ